MSIEDRKLVGIAAVEARYKSETFRLTVERDAADNLSFLDKTGIRYKSLSAAGSAVMGGIACNGWRFWTPEGDLPLIRTKAEPKIKTRSGRREPAAIFTIKTHPAPEGQAFWFCSYCLDGFYAPTADGTPECPSCKARGDNRGMVAAADALAIASEYIESARQPLVFPTPAEAARAVIAAAKPKKARAPKKAKTSAALEALMDAFEDGDIPESDDDLYQALG